MTLQKDWTGNSRSTHAVLGARNYAQNERENNDYYATEPKAAHLLMEVEWKLTSSMNCSTQLFSFSGIGNMTKSALTNWLRSFT